MKERNEGGERKGKKGGEETERMVDERDRDIDRHHKRSQNYPLVIL